MARRWVPSPTFLCSSCASTLNRSLRPSISMQLGTHRHLLAFRGGSEMLDVHLEADGGVPFRQMGLHGLDAGALHQADHRWRGQHAIASHVLDHQLVVDCRDALGFQSRCQASVGMCFSPLIEQPQISRIPFKLAWPALPTMMWSCTAMPSGAAMSTMALVIWMSACDGVGSYPASPQFAEYHINSAKCHSSARRRHDSWNTRDRPRFSGRAVQTRRSENSSLFA